MTTSDSDEQDRTLLIEGADITAEDGFTSDGEPVSQEQTATQSQSTFLALIVSAAFFMEILDGAIITPAIPQMAQSFGSPPVAVSSGISSYLISVAIFIPASAWLSDRLGPRKVFAGAIVLFTLASVLCGLSQNLTEFTLARILQGLAGAMMSPVGRMEVFRRTERIHVLRMLAFMSWPGLTAFIVGPPLGGTLTSFASWRWIFFINIPIGLIGTTLVWIYFDKKPTLSRRAFDALGFALNGGSLACLLYGIESVSRDKPLWFAAAFTILGLVLGATAVWHATHSTNPLLSLAPMRIKSFSVATLSSGALFRLAAAGLGFMVPLMLQIAFGMTPFDAGLLTVALLTGDLSIKPVANRIIRTYGFRNTLLYGGALVALTGGLLLVLDQTSPVWMIVVVFYVVGATRSVQYTALNSLIFADMPSPLIGPASTVNSMLQPVFNGLGVGFAALTLSVFANLHGEEQVTLLDFRLAFGVMMALAIATVLTYIPLPANLGEHISGHKPKTISQDDLT